MFDQKYSQYMSKVIVLLTKRRFFLQAHAQVNPTAWTMTVELET